MAAAGWGELDRGDTWRCMGNKLTLNPLPPFLLSLPIIRNGFLIPVSSTEFYFFSFFLLPVTPAVVPPCSSLILLNCHSPCPSSSIFCLHFPTGQQDFRSRVRAWQLSDRNLFVSRLELRERLDNSYLALLFFVHTSFILSLMSIIILYIPKNVLFSI